MQDTARRRAESAADEADLEENALGHLGSRWMNSAKTYYRSKGDYK